MAWHASQVRDVRPASAAAKKLKAGALAHAKLMSDVIRMA